MTVSRQKLIVFSTLAVATAAAPSLGLAFSGQFDSDSVSLSALGGIGSFTPASVDPKLASTLKFGAVGGKNFRFTPATQGQGKRAVTVAVRINPESTKAINIRPNMDVPGAQDSPLKITPTGYSLGTSKGWQKFALPREVRDISMPDLGTYRGRIEEKDEPSRFNTRIELDSSHAVGGAPRTLTGEDNYSVDVGGSYKLTRNLDVTAGVRLQSERDRLAPLTNEQQDSQAVYVGTQFRF